MCRLKYIYANIFIYITGPIGRFLVCVTLKRMAKISIVVAASASNHGIGIGGALPWRLKRDMEFFKHITTHTGVPGNQNVVIMGRKTWESLPAKFRPLDGRINVVISRNTQLAEETNLPSTVHVCSSLTSAIELATNGLPCIEHIFIIGGGSIYAEAMEKELAKTIYVTEVTPPHTIEFDTWFPAVSANRFAFSSASEMFIEQDYTFRFLTYDKIVE